MTLDVTYINGECSGVQDCNKETSRKTRAAQYCLLKNGGTNYNLQPTTVCSHCIADAECPEETYCQENDQGIC